MRYDKPPLTFQEQADLLLSRGMKGDRSAIMDRLAVVNYYRLSGYWHPFRCPGDDTFRPNTTFETVWQRYAFDRHLRLLVMDAVERIEVAVRTQLAYHLAHQSGDPFAYAIDPAVLPGLSFDQRQRLLEDLTGETVHSKETFVEHFRNKYGDQHAFMPIWMAAEVMTFGCVLTLFRGVHPDIRKQLAVRFGVHDTVLASWLLTLNTVRNICAHHGRLWNREFGVQPKIPRKIEAWNMPVPVAGQRMFTILTVCKHCLDQIAPQSHWPARWRELLASYPYIPRGSMGFPAHWEACPIWAESKETDND
ncbi:MAG TPA: Abi family protein [Thermoguttaceae bacterium]|nr:Abi family protein [Thermoguttaceae bacterium]